jgi:hypothetical protein
MSRHALWFGVVAAVAFAACTLDFGQFRGEASGGHGAGASGGSSGGGGTAGDGGTGASGGSGGSAGSGGAGGSGGTAGAGGGLPAGCINDTQDGSETDVDCGGDECPGCENGLSCGDYADCLSQFCSASICAACSGPSDCAAAPDTYCEGGSCAPQKALGGACADVGECLSGQCVDSVCCDEACGGLCRGCTAALTGGNGGTCGPVLGTTDPESECGAQVCNGAGACADLCGLTPTPPGGTCPPECTGGCNAGVCTIACNAAGECQGNPPINCPAGFACVVSCGGTDGCRQNTINCPDGYPCTVTCTGQTACRFTNVNCSATGVCNVACGSANQTCRDGLVTCGGNSCQVTCPGSFPPTVACGSSCSCTPC